MPSRLDVNHDAPTGVWTVEAFDVFAQRGTPKSVQRNFRLKIHHLLVEYPP
jgi:hypothetical protein